jgi:hypothetical protein
MSEWRPRPSLICSALLGALVISCGGPVAPVVTPAPAAAPAPAAEPAPAVEPAPAPRAVPAPEVAPVPAPAVPPRRPGGAPPGTALVDLPGGDDLTVAEWMDAMADACGDHGPSCLKVRKNFIDNNKCTDEEGRVRKQDPPLGNGNVKVSVGSRVILEIECPLDESTKQGESTEHGESTEQGESNESTNRSSTDQTSESATIDRSDE